MPTLNTFARLNKPKQFRPREPVTFNLQYSEDLAPTKATLKIYGGDYGLDYLPYKQTQYINTAIDGVFFETFEVPAYALGEDPCEASDWTMTTAQRGLTVVVEMGDGQEADYPVKAMKVRSKGIMLSSKYNPESEDWFVEWKSVVEEMNECYGGFTVPTSIPTHEEVRAVNARFHELYCNDSGHVSNVTFSSNLLSVPLYFAPEKPLVWAGSLEETITSSVWNTYIFYNSCFSQIGSQTDHYINSYRYFLYDGNRRIVFDSGIRYDWSLTNNLSKNILFSGLKDNKTYYCKARATLVGGYVIESEVKTLHVKYKTVLLTSDELSVRNIHSKGVVEIATKIKKKFDKLIIDRTVKNEGQYLQIGQYDTSENIIILDSMCLPNTVYTYRVTAYDNDVLVGTYCSEITHEFSGLCLADIYGVYCAKVNEHKYPVQKNARTTFQTTTGSKYPYAIITSAADYHESSSTSGNFFDTENECMPTNEDIQNGNNEHSHTILNWLNNGCAKLLKYDNGFAAIIAIDGKPSIQQNETTRLYSVNFGWNEIADCKDIGNYTKCGLVGEI